MLFQLSAYYQALYSVIHSVETVELLDYKFTQGVYRQLPGIAFQTYILLYMSRNEGFFSYSVLVAIFSSLIGLVVIYIMIYDRIQSRRMAMLPHKFQPKCAAIVAQDYVCCGMGVGTGNVQGLVHVHAFYTSTSTWVYLPQLMSQFTQLVILT